jgi:RNA polymerase sigma factor (sigma-70 family)
MDTGLPASDTAVKTPWDLRAAVCKAGAEQVRDLEDDALMFLLLEAVDPQDIDELFAELYSRYHARVNSWCRRFIRDPHRADDMTQEVFLRAFRYRSSFRGEARTSTWLFTVTRNYCLTAIRKANGDPSTGASLLDPRLKGSSGFETHQKMERDEAFALIWRLINTALTPKEARVMVLHYGHGLPLALITRQLALTNPSGAKAYIVNAKRKLGVVLARRRTEPGRIAA